MTDLKKKNILICDDEEGIRESLKLILENKYELLFADDGNQCLAHLKGKSDINLILLDIKMPQINGLDVLKQIKKIKPRIKVVMVSGYKSAETTSSAIHNGASEYIVKPFEKKDILQTIEKMIGK